MGHNFFDFVYQSMVTSWKFHIFHTYPPTSNKFYTPHHSFLSLDHVGVMHPSIWSCMLASRGNIKRRCHRGDVQRSANISFSPWWITNTNYICYYSQLHPDHCLMTILFMCLGQWEWLDGKNAWSSLWIQMLDVLFHWCKRAWIIRVNICFMLC